MRSLFRLGILKATMVRCMGLSSEPVHSRAPINESREMLQNAPKWTPRPKRADPCRAVFTFPDSAFVPNIYVTVRDPAAARACRSAVPRGTRGKGTERKGKYDFLPLHSLFLARATAPKLGRLTRSLRRASEDFLTRLSRKGPCSTR